MSLVIEHMGGYCPFQAEGTVNGIPFYFRARMSRWQFAIAEDPVGAILGLSEGWVRSGPKEQAGYIPEEEAMAIIHRCVDEYLEEQNDP